MKHSFKTIKGVSAAEIVQTRQEAIDRTIESQQPHATWDGQLQCFRLFTPVSKTDCVDYSAVLNEPHLVKWEIFRKVLK